MWILTSFGFFSVVRKPEDVEGDMLTIRGRVLSDLENLRDAYLPNASPISEHRQADYRYRFRAPASDFGDAMSRIAQDIDYDNFKDAVLARQGWTRHDIYLTVWTSLCQLNCCDQESSSKGVRTCPTTEG